MFFVMLEMKYVERFMWGLIVNFVLSNFLNILDVFRKKKKLDILWNKNKIFLKKVFSIWDEGENVVMYILGFYLIIKKNKFLLFMENRWRWNLLCKVSKVRFKKKKIIYVFYCVEYGF